jgi:hypothetical protein
VTWWRTAAAPDCSAEIVAVLKGRTFKLAAKDGRTAQQAVEELNSQSDWVRWRTSKKHPDVLMFRVLRDPDAKELE